MTHLFVSRCLEIGIFYKSMVAQAHVYIKGDVVGVGFRAWSKIQAKYNNINGWVRNVYEEVEAVFQGEKEDVEKMVELVKQGPPVSRVEDVEVVYEEVKEMFSSFEIRK